MGHVESHVNQEGPPCKAKYSWVTDSEVVPYRISGSSLLAVAAMDKNSQVPYADVLSVQPGNLSDDKEQTDGYGNHSEKPHDVLYSLTQNDEKYSRVDDRSGRVHPTVDIAEVLINQLKEVAPTLQNSISELTEEASSISSNLPPGAEHQGRSTSPIQAQTSGRAMLIESSSSDVQIEKVSASPPALKLPPLFSVTPNSSGKGGNVQKQHTLSHTNQIEIMSERNSVDQPLSNSHIDVPHKDNQSDDSSKHFFVPLSGTGFSHIGQDTKLGSGRNKLLFASHDLSIGKHAPNSNAQSKHKELRHVRNDLDSFQEYDGENDFLSGAGSNCTVSDSQTSCYDDEEARDQVFSPSLLLDTSLMGDFYEHLLAPLSETETAWSAKSQQLLTTSTPFVLQTTEAVSVTFKYWRLERTPGQVGCKMYWEFRLFDDNLLSSKKSDESDG
ncbi:hypothetical protein Vadar_026990 [Vaccinium darrowii]|uniref:Uncharacterized protein n=2 Tax=Vaccinium darrowii TaxID=229202 RepID=A0ACB7XYX5_9ERIC|nr:hypothetical protein Vadar_014251 [Vaccinium darrowii]KAH7847508.1 hypothetical protein Vadar_026990 [Vaccinium darrowii]